MLQPQGRHQSVCRELEGCLQSLHMHAYIYMYPHIKALKYTCNNSHFELTLKSYECWAHADWSISSAYCSNEADKILYRTQPTNLTISDPLEFSLKRAWPFLRYSVYIWVLTLRCCTTALQQQLPLFLFFYSPFFNRSWDGQRRGKKKSFN